MSTLSKIEWPAIRSLAEDRSIVIKKADQGFRVVVLDRLDCLSEAEKELGDKNICRDFLSVTKCFVIWYKEVMFLKLKRKGSISEKETKNFVYDCKNTSNLGNLCFLPKLHEILFNIPGRPVISKSCNVKELVLYQRYMGFYRKY